MFIMNNVAPRKEKDMDTEQLMLDVGQANELKLAFRRAGWTNADIKRLCEGDILALLLAVLKGELVVKHLIDCDADPMVPDGWEVVEHRKVGQFEWDPAKVVLHLDEAQQGGAIVGNKLRGKLKGQPVLNANVLDYLLAHPYFIPEEWKGKLVFFWGTIYRYAGGGLYVRCLYWSGDRWFWHCFWLGLDFDDRSPAAVLASS